MTKHEISLRGLQVESVTERLERVTANEAWRTRVEEAISAWRQGGAIQVVVEKSG